MDNKKPLETIKKFGTPLMKGLISQAAPSLLRGVLLDYLSNIQMERLQFYVANNISIWEKVDPDYQQKIRNLCSGLKHADWLTAEWLVTSARARITKIGEKPDPKLQKEKQKLCALNSYFLSSKSAYTWLDSQTVVIRTSIFK